METKDGFAGAILFGKTRGAVLGVLFGEPEGWYHLRDLARRAGAGVGPAHREMVTLAEAGLVERVQRGKQVFYRVNRGSSVYHELRGLVMKTVGAGEVSSLRGPGALGSGFGHTRRDGVGFGVRGEGGRALEREEMDVTLL